MARMCPTLAQQHCDFGGFPWRQLINIRGWQAVPRLNRRRRICAQNCGLHTVGQDVPDFEVRVVDAGDG